MNNIKVVLTLITIIFIVGCKAKKETVLPKEKLKNISEAKLFSEIEKNAFVYNSILCKKIDCNVEFKGSKLSFKGSLYIKRDSIIVISVVPLMGIELFKVALMPYEYIVIDRTKKQVIRGSIGDLKTKYGLDFSFDDIQNILTNGFFGIQCDNLAFKDCFKKLKSGDNNKQYYLRSLRERKFEKLEKSNSQCLLFFEYLIDPNYFRISKVNIRELPDGGRVEIGYNDFKKLENIVFPYKIDISGKKDKEAFDFSFTLDQIEKDGKNDIGFKIPEKYSKVSGF